MLDAQFQVKGIVLKTFFLPRCILVIVFIMPVDLRKVLTVQVVPFTDGISESNRVHHTVYASYIVTWRGFKLAWYPNMQGYHLFGVKVNANHPTPWFAS